mmetsp:Transcript_43131/g.99369  ORF Transcript_43131/g.99369 Transcript_43131/m.99369 type:complete len:514 (+) Transcript_43131:92-1633(+)
MALSIARLSNKEGSSRPQTPVHIGVHARPVSALSRASGAVSSLSRPTTPYGQRKSRPSTASRSSSGQKVINPLGPHSHAQHIAELCCVQFRMQQQLNAEKPRKPPAKAALGLHVSDEQEKAQAAYRSLPASLRPSAVQVEAEMHEAECGALEATASLILGRQALANFQRAMSQFHSHLNHGLVDLKVWMSAARGDLLVASVGTDFAARVLAAIYLLHGAAGILAIDASELQLEDVPEPLRLFTSMRYLNLSRNKPLNDLRGLRACHSLQAIDLSDCPHVYDVRYLGMLPNLEVVLLARCHGIEDIRPLVLCGHKADQCDGLELDLLDARRGNKGAREMWPITPHIPLGHPSLRWLVLDGCAHLRQGTASLRLCNALTYVDLFGCTNVDAMDCYLLEKETSAQRSSRWTMVWPDIDKIQGLAIEQGWTNTLLSSVLEAASAAAAEKLALSKGGFMPPVTMDEGVFRLPRPLERTWRAGMVSAHRAALEFGVEFTMPEADGSGGSEGARAVPVRA